MGCAIALVGVACASNSSSSEQRCATCNGSGTVLDKGWASSWVSKYIVATENLPLVTHAEKECPDCEGWGEAPIVSSSDSSDSSSSSSSRLSSGEKRAALKLIKCIDEQILERKHALVRCQECLMDVSMYLHSKKNKP